MLLILCVAIASILFLTFVTILDWKKLIFSVLIFLILEGVVRKWILPQASNFIYFIKDFVVLVAYYKYFLVSGEKIKTHYINFLISLLAIWSIVQAFNPNLGSPIIGFFGLRAYLLYIPLMWMLPNLFASSIDELYKFIRNYSLIIIPVCLLAVAQFFSPSSSPLNIYAGGTENIATFGVGSEGVVRVTGTFPYITGFGTYLSVSFTLLIPLITLKQPIIWRNLTIVELLLVIVGSFMTGSRAVIFYEILFIIGYGVLSLLIQPEKTWKLLKKFFFPVVIGINIIPIYFSKSINLFSERNNKNSEEGITRVYGPFLQTMAALEKVVSLKFIDSYGTGSAHQATPMLRNLLNLPQINSTYADIGEEETGRVAVEIGALGLIAWIAIRMCLAFSLWQTIWRIQHPFLQQLALSAFLFHAIQITAPVVFNPTMNIYYWFFAGFIFLLPAIERREEIEYYLHHQQAKL
jgi:hypothetical protein